MKRFAGLALLCACASPAPVAPAREPQNLTASESRILVNTPPPSPPVDVAALVSEAVAAREAGDDATARTRLDAALVARPAFGPALVERAELLVAGGTEPEVAAVDAENAARVLPNEPRAHRVHAQTLEEAGHVEEALAAYRRALELKDEPSLVRRVAQLEKKLGRPAAAVTMWERARDANPADPSARLELAELYEKTDRPVSASAEWGSVVELLPQNAVLRRRYAEFLDRQGKPGEARVQRRKADALDPPDAARKLRPLQPSKR